MTSPGGLLQQREQYRKRQGMTWKDQHNRDWEVVIDLDIDTMTWCGPPILRNCKPPADIPQVFVKPVKDDTGRVVMGKIFCDFQAWYKEQAEHDRYWKNSLRDRAKQMYPNSYGEVLKAPSRDLLIEVGPGPMPTELIEAMAAGNKWALGIRKPDGTFYQRPVWVTESMLERVAALKSVTGWSEHEEVGDMDTSADKYPDFLEEEETFDPDAVGGKTIAVKKSSTKKSH